MSNNNGNGKASGNGTGKTNGHAKKSNLHGNGNGAATERWAGIERPYNQTDVERLRGTVHVEHTLARMGAERLWELMNSTPYVHALGALTGNQAVEMAAAGLQAIYVSGWQVAADANDAGQTYPDQSLYPVDSVPNLCRRLNNALLRADQIAHAEGKDGTHWVAPLVADAEAGFGGCLNAFELMKAMIEAGAAAVHFEDQLSSAKKCGHLGGKVVVPVREFIEKLGAARLGGGGAGVHREAGRGAAGGGRSGRSHAPDCADGRGRGAAAAQRCGSGGRAFPGRGTARGGLLPVQGRHRGGDRARAGVRSLCRRSVV